MKNFTAKSAYDAVKKLISYVCVKFKQKYGGNLQDYISYAQEIFMDAFLSYDSSQGEFSKRVSYLIWHRLEDTLRKTRHVQFINGCEYKITARCERFDIEEFIDNLSMESQHLVRLIVKKKIKSKKKVIQHLMDQYEWNAEKILNSFQEIREELYT